MGGGVELSLAGATIGHFSVPNGGEAGGIAFDGTNLWVVGPGSVTELSPTGATLATFDVADVSGGIAFDGTNMWVISDMSVIELSPTGQTLGSFPVPPAAWSRSEASRSTARTCGSPTPAPTP